MVEFFDLDAVISYAGKLGDALTAPARGEDQPEPASRGYRGLSPRALAQLARMRKIAGDVIRPASR
jgi:hypothetical protein